MTHTSTVGLFKLALDLDEHDRATLAGLLIESLEQEPDQDLGAAWNAEIERRIAELESGQARAIPWEEVREKLLKREHETEKDWVPPFSSPGSQACKTMVCGTLSAGGKGILDGIESCRRESRSRTREVA